MIRTKFLANVTNVEGGLQITCESLDNLYILVEDKNQLETQCRRIFAEMSGLTPDSLELQFIFK